MKQAFTLVELLVVVLIIGILTAVALPMYQGAVDKSRWSVLLTPAKALQTAQAAAYLETGAYADDASALTVSLPGETEDNKFILPDAEYSIDTKSASQSTITGQLNTLPNVKLSIALKNPDSYLFCDAKTGDSRAERLCEKWLGGTKASTKSGYTKYILDYPGTCIWANSTGQCYTSEEARCTAMGMPYSNGMCGYTDWQVSSSTQINEGGVCVSTGGGCRDLQVNEGGVCKAGGYNGCYNAKIHDGGICEATDANTWGCGATTINKGGICMGNYSMSCRDITVDGGKCIAKAQGACGKAGPGSTYINGGCCEDYGKGYCPSNAPKCSD